MKAPSARALFVVGLVTCAAAARAARAEDAPTPPTAPAPPLASGPPAAPASTLAPPPEPQLLPLELAGEVTAERPKEPQAPSFGARGEIVVDGDSAVGISEASWTGSAAASFSADVAPGFDYFVLPNLSIGIAVDFSYALSRGYGADGSIVETKTTTLQGGPRIGLNVPLGASPFSFWPRVTVGFESIDRVEQGGGALSTSFSPLGYASTTQTGPYVSVYAPVLYHPVSHFFAGAGPTLFRDFAALRGGPDVGGQRTALGAGFVVGGYWGGRAGVAEATAPAPPREPLRRFGDRGETVLDGELVAAGSVESYQGSPSSGSAFDLYVGLDYFVIDGLAVGGGAWVSATHATGVDAATGAPVTSSIGSRGAFARLGYNIALARALSWFPRATLSIGVTDYDEASAGGEDKYSAMVVDASIFAPLLVHPAAHFFVGFGPSATTDLSRTATFPGGATSSAHRDVLGAGLIVGGWL